MESHLFVNNSDILDCIQETNTKTEKSYRYDPDSTKRELIETVYVKLKLYDKQRALENLGKNLGYYEEDNKQKTPVIQYQNVSNQFPDK